MSSQLLLILLVTGIAHASFPALPVITTSLVYEGLVIKNHTFVHGSVECRDEHSEQCEKFVNTTCESMEQVFRTHEDLQWTAEHCYVSWGNRDFTKIEIVFAPSTRKTYDFYLTEFVIPPIFVDWFPENSHLAYVDYHYGVNLTSHDTTPYTPDRRRLEITVMPLMNHKKVLYKDVCATFTSLQCIEFSNYLCNATGEALNRHSEFDRLYSYCFVTATDRQLYVKIVVFLFQSRRYSWTDYRKLALVLPVSTFTDRENVPHIGLVDNVTGVGIDDNGWSLDDTRRPKIFIEGYTWKYNKNVTYTTECTDDPIGQRCLRFKNSLCRTVQEAFHLNYQLSLVYSACEVRAQTGDKVTATVYAQPQAKKAPRNDILWALNNTMHLLDKWVYFYQVTSITGHKIAIV